MVAGNPVQPQTVAYFTMQYPTMEECIEMRNEIAKTMYAPITQGTYGSLVCMKIQLDQEQPNLPPIPELKPQPKTNT